MTKREQRKIISLMRYGIDSELAKQIVEKGFSVTKLRTTSQGDLTVHFDNDKAREIKKAITRTPIHEQEGEKLIRECDWKCCICWDIDNIQSVVIHHIVEHSKTQDNTYDNLVLLCPNHHADAHSKSDIAGDRLPPKLLLERKQDFIKAIAAWKNGLREAPGREGKSKTEPEKKLNLTVHRAFFSHNERERYFINATNISDKEIEVTHVWFDCKPQIHAFVRDRPLPKRLKPNETWETWIEVDKVPIDTRENPYTLARARLSTGTIINSHENKNVPEQGSVPGGTTAFVMAEYGSILAATGTVAETVKLPAEGDGE